MNVCPAPTVAVKGSATYRVDVINEGGCKSSDDITITAVCNGSNYFLPNTFSPNGDGKNETFRAYGNAIAGVSMKVFNQWGELIYEGSEYTTGWDGKFKGKLQPMGVYFYVFKIKLVNGTESNRKGSVNLLH